MNILYFMSLLHVRLAKKKNKGLISSIFRAITRTPLEEYEEITGLCSRRLRIELQPASVRTNEICSPSPPSLFFSPIALYTYYYRSGWHLLLTDRLPSVFSQSVSQSVSLSVSQSVRPREILRVLEDSAVHTHETDADRFIHM